MQTDQQAPTAQQQRETGARGLPDQPVGTAAQALGGAPQPEPAPSERCSSASPPRSLGDNDPKQQDEAGKDAAAQAAAAERRPASAPPHARPSKAGGGQEPALLLQLLAEEACRAGSVATDLLQDKQQHGAGILQPASGPVQGGQGGLQGARPQLSQRSSAAHPSAAVFGADPRQQEPHPAAGAAGAQQLPRILQELLAAHALHAGLQQLGPAAAAHQPPPAALEPHVLRAATTAAAGAPAGDYAGSPAAPLAAQWQHGWHGPQAMQVDTAPPLQLPHGSAAAAAIRHQAGHNPRAAAGRASAAAAVAHTSGHAYHAVHRPHAATHAAALQSHRSSPGKHAPRTAAAAAEAVAAAASHPTDASLRRAQKWQLAAQVALQSMGQPASADVPSPRPRLARHQSAVTSRELGERQGGGEADSPSSPHRPTALKRSITDLLSPRAQQLLSHSSPAQAADPAQWILEMAAGGRSSKRQALAPLEPLAEAQPLADGQLAAAMQWQQAGAGCRGGSPAASPMQHAGGDCTGGTPSSGPSPAPSGDSFAFPPRREATPPTPKSATAAAAATEAARAAAAAAPATAGRAAAGTSAAAAAPVSATGGSPTAAAAKAGTAAAMQRAAMLALQAEAVHRVRREMSRLLQLEMLIAMMERDGQQSGSPASASPITPQLLPQPLASAHLSAQPSGSAQISLQPSASTHVSLTPPGAAQLAAQLSGSSRLSLQPLGSTHLTLQPSSSMRVVMQGLLSPQAGQAAGLPSPSLPPTPASPPVPACTAAGAAAPASPTGAPLAEEFGALLNALQRAGLRPEDVGQLQKLAAYLHPPQSPQ